MTNLPPTDPNSSRLGFDELIGIVIAFATIGTILAVTLGQRDKGFNLSRFLNPEAENRTTDPIEELPSRPVLLPTASPEATTLPTRPQEDATPSPSPSSITVLPVAPVPALPVASTARPAEVETPSVPTTVLNTKPEVPSTPTPSSPPPPPPPSPSTDQPWQEWVQVASEFLSQLPDYVTDFFSSYQKPLLTVALILTGGITVKVTLAVLDALNDIPLLAPVFELVGIGYTAWFVYRYLLKVETRQELADEFKALKGQVVGKEE